MEWNRDRSFRIGKSNIWFRLDDACGTYAATESESSENGNNYIRGLCAIVQYLREPDKSCVSIDKVLCRYNIHLVLLLR